MFTHDLVCLGISEGILDAAYGLHEMVGSSHRATDDR